MKHRFLAAVLLAMLFGGTSCSSNVLRGKGAKANITPSLSSFNAIKLGGAITANVHMKTGAATSVTISGYENIVKHIKAEVNNNELYIYTDLDGDWSIVDRDFTVEITMPELVRMKMSGAADANVHGCVAGTALAITVSGAGNVRMDSLLVDNFVVNISGAGDLQVKGGAAKHAHYEIDGAGDVKAFALQTDETEASISGAGDGHVTALHKLSASTPGPGSIRYKGHPVLTQAISGAGSISDAN